MNFKQLRRSDELEKVDVFKQSDSYAVRLMVLRGPAEHVRVIPRCNLVKNTLPNMLANKRKEQEVLLLCCTHQPNHHSQCIEVSDK